MVRFSFTAVVAAISISSANAFAFNHPAGIAPSSTSLHATDRRTVLRNVLLVPAAVTVATSEPVYAIDSCPKGSKNCIRQTWNPPAGTSSSDLGSMLRDVLNQYPQEGQADVDGGGYKIVMDSLSESSGRAVSVEYRSAGTGNFAKFFNGGKPFVDDLVIEVEPDGSKVEFRSSSRVGDSDFGVNSKRLAYLGDLLKNKGWTGVGLSN
mmetsp:Transcript_19480/g.44362  ORF Transcript_19480/g.44362 Transcript_19480/m.44362 type:complete len:208 (-) Transcript_19480:210-833(-)